MSGTSVTWVTAKGPAMGWARVYIDSVDKGVVILFALTPQWKVPITFSGLSAGPHVVEVEVVPGTATVVVDAFK